MDERPDKPKWGKEQIFWYVAGVVFLFVILPLLIIFYFMHRVAGVH